MKYLLFIIVLILNTSCKVNAISYDTEKAQNEAMKFAKDAFMLLDINNSYKKLNSNLSSKTNIEQFLEIISKMHPFGTPKHITNVGYQLNVSDTYFVSIMEASNNLDTFYYTVSINLKDEKYDVIGFNYFTNLQYQKIKQAGLMICDNKKTLNFSDVSSNSYTAELKKQLLREKVLVKTSGQYQIFNIDQSVKIKIEDIFQIYYESQSSWSLIIKYRTSRKIDEIKNITMDAKYYFDKKIKKIANEIDVKGIVLLAVENIDKHKNTKRHQYGVVFRKGLNNVWEILK